MELVHSRITQRSSFSEWLVELVHSVKNELKPGLWSKAGADALR